MRTFLAEIIGQVLSLAQIEIEKAWTLEGPALAMRLLDETELLIVMTWQRSGFLSIMIFSLLFVLLTFPLKGPLWCKIAWLGLGNVVGLAWSLIRLFLLVVAAYYLGVGAFKVVDFVTGPAIDFLWIVPVWSLGLSLLAYAERRKRTKGR
jgi:exosortase/archaeosortase family protein